MTVANIIGIVIGAVAAGYYMKKRQAKKAAEKN